MYTIADTLIKACRVTHVIATASDKQRAHTARDMRLQLITRDVIMTHLTHLMLTALAQVCSLLQLLKHLRACWHHPTQTLIVQEALCEVLSLTMYLHLSEIVRDQAESQLDTCVHCIGPECQVKVRKNTHVDHA